MAPNTFLPSMKIIKTCKEIPKKGPGGLTQSNSFVIPERQKPRRQAQV